MRWCHFGVFLALCTSVALCADSLRYFPPLSHSKKAESDAFIEEWYSAQLRALKEPALCCSNVAPARVYRFTWLRTFHNPVAIALEENSADSWTLRTKVADGAGGYGPGKLVVNDSRDLSVEKVAPLRKLLEPGSQFWRLPTVDESDGGFDGSQWIVEVRVGAHYHYVDRWTPEKGMVRELGLMFMKLSGKTFGEVY